MSLAPEKRFVQTDPIRATVSGEFQIVAPQTQTLEIEEVFFQVFNESNNSANVARVTILAGQYAQTPAWVFEGGGFANDPGFILQAGTPIILAVEVASGGPWDVMWMVRYRSTSCGPKADSAIRRSNVFSENYTTNGAF
jgi:hypothetical protein